MLGDRGLELEDKLYWGRFVGGIIMGIITACFKLYQPTILIGISIMIIAYMVSAIALRVLLSAEKRRSLGRSLYLSGAATYAASWLITLIILYNLML